MAKCQCRWNCDHGSTYSESRTSLDCEGRCQRVAAWNYVRFTCPYCQLFRIYEVCDKCWERLNKYLQSQAACHCEQCRERFTTKEVWSLYQDKEG